MGGGEGLPHVPLKRLQIFGQKNDIKHKKLTSQPQVPPSKEFENGFASI
jgi:hypothetical protein